MSTCWPNVQWYDDENELNTNVEISEDTTLLTNNDRAYELTARNSNNHKSSLEKVHSQIFQLTQH